AVKSRAQRCCRSTPRQRPGATVTRTQRRQAQRHTTRTEPRAPRAGGAVPEKNGRSSCGERNSALRHRLQRNGARQGIAKIRKTVAAPGELFGVNVPIVPAMFAARLRMVNNPVLGLTQRLHERTMTDAPD